MNESSVVVFRASLCVSIASARRFWSVFGHLLLQLLRLLRPVPFLRCAWDMVQPSASFGVQRNLLARQCPPAHTSSSFPWSLLPCSLTDRFSSVSRRHRLGALRHPLLPSHGTAVAAVSACGLAPGIGHRSPRMAQTGADRCRVCDGFLRASERQGPADFPSTTRLAPLPSWRFHPDYTGC